MILDEPTNHLDADSIIWLREYLKTYEGGLMIISHDLDLIDEVVNTVFFLMQHVKSLIFIRWATEHT